MNGYVYQNKTKYSGCGGFTMRVYKSQFSPQIRPYDCTSKPAIQNTHRYLARRQSGKIKFHYVSHADNQKAKKLSLLLTNEGSIKVCLKKLKTTLKK